MLWTASQKTLLFACSRINNFAITTGAGLSCVVEEWEIHEPGFYVLVELRNWWIYSRCFRKISGVQFNQHYVCAQLCGYHKRKILLLAVTGIEISQTRKHMIFMLVIKEIRRRNPGAWFSCQLNEDIGEYCIHNIFQNKFLTHNAIIRNYSVEIKKKNLSTLNIVLSATNSICFAQ